MNAHLLIRFKNLGFSKVYTRQHLDTVSNALTAITQMKEKLLALPSIPVDVVGAWIEDSPTSRAHVKSTLH